ncbi:hypothetical protein FSP39_016944 [Pinctada imbricata]|uniref:Endonuclease/exonuclease/phosphatase domain-containing protein n=1 Tax=Pinctada imbricata TaxID=66713 RepID=A0AA88XMX2_PINIB|nr:hypothetical protein FSP39_016944 [Pinctada imbricata]
MTCTEAPTNLLSTKTILHIGTWNFRTMYDARKAARIAAEMRRYSLSLLGLCETKWTQSEQRRFMTGETILFSGREEDGAPHSLGVGLMMGKEAQKAFIGWKPRGPRHMTASFRTKLKNIKMNVIVCYASTNDIREEDKDNFYEQFSAILEQFSNKDINMLMGDFNAKIGDDNKGFEEIMGCYGIGEMNEDGERFAETCAINSFVIGGSIYQHKRIHKATWISPDHVTENQIDHICICKKFRRSLLDVRVKRGADVASDHQLVTAKMRIN